MDFIERLFGVSPDGGSGLFEFLLFAVPLAGAAWLIRRRALARRRPSPPTRPTQDPRP